MESKQPEHWRIIFFPSVKKVPVCVLELLPMQGAVQKSFLHVLIYAGVMFASQDATRRWPWSC